MQKLIVVALNGKLDLKDFNKSVEAPIEISELKPLLFANLYQKIAESHENSQLRIWGVPRGHKSSIANKWNQISEGDVCLFLFDGNLIGYSKVKIKFQSESVANQLWLENKELSTRQYLFTLDDLMHFDNDLISNAIKLWRKGKFNVSDLEVFENAKSAEFISSLHFPTDSGHDVKESQGFGLNSAERKAIELYAVETAINFLRKMGYSEIQDVGSIYSYDLHAIGPEGRLHVEVKGTTGKGEKVILTRNEVAFQKSCYPENALLIVSGIEIDFEGDLSTSGGEINFVSPWNIFDADLTPISFEYTV
jgi:hypothetical protein